VNVKGWLGVRLAGAERPIMRAEAREEVRRAEVRVEVRIFGDVVDRLE
jgi:hypothetical protein